MESAHAPVARITPAHAGKSFILTKKFRSFWDHPRVRGEKLVCGLERHRTRGSPPRARGKGLGVAVQRGQRGITPACAGKSLRTPRKYSRGWDHPRVRGEKVLVLPSRVVRLGSPPRARGKVILAVIGLVLSGITPACAGKRDTGKMLRNNIGDHPRVRGEKYLKLPDTFYIRGSPPRARGKVMA